MIGWSCAERPFVPVNEGREYGNPKTPFVVSHLPEANQWALGRTGHHSFLRKILCFNYSCRKMIGRRKVLKAISLEAFKKRVRKNARKGAYKKPISTPTIKEVKPDTIPVAMVAEPVVQPEPAKPIYEQVLKADSLIILSEFLFEVNSFKLKQIQYAALDSIGQFLADHQTLVVIVSGHTDSTGSERHNVSLSTRRAEVVAEYLIDRGALFDKVSFAGFGSSRPIMGNETEAGRSKNRRVEILIRNPERR